MTQFFRVKFNRWDTKRLEDLDIEKFRALWPDAPEMEPDQELDSWLYTFSDTAIIPAGNIQELLNMGVKVELAATTGNMFIKRLNDLFSDRGYGMLEHAQNGNVMQVHIPNEYLYRINEVEVLDDCCTDRLREYLDDGWRIICVCPPNSQRRPDYVIGRHTPHKA
jgi:hypothetical protein